MRKAEEILHKEKPSKFSWSMKHKAWWQCLNNVMKKRKDFLKGFFGINAWKQNAGKLI